MSDPLSLAMFQQPGTDAEVARIRAEADAKAAAAIADAEQKGRLLRALAAAPDVPATLAGVSHFYHGGSRLYGSVASLDLGDRWSRYSYANQPRRLRVADLLPLARAFPAVSMLTHRDGCIGFRPVDYTDARDSERAQRDPIAPVWVHGHDWSDQSPAALEMWLEVPTVGRVRINAHFPGNEALRGFAMTGAADRDIHGEVVSWHNVRATLPDWFGASPLAAGHRTIRYAAATRKNLPDLRVMFRPELSAVEVLTELAKHEKAEG